MTILDTFTLFDKIGLFLIFIGIIIIGYFLSKY
jgi:hypothetical protein